MSDLGYKNSAQQGLDINYDSLEEYSRTLTNAVKQSYEPYEQLGIKDANGEYQQLNTNILQIENEYYSDIRPKRVARSGERPVLALRRRGVEYIEVRSLDINPYLPVGMDVEQCKFINAFVLYCLLSNSPEQCPDEWAEIEQNQRNIIERGRDPELQLSHCGNPGTVQEHAMHICDEIATCSELLDQAYLSDDHVAALNVQREKIMDPAKTPSGVMMAQVLEGAEFIDLVQEQARQHAMNSIDTGLDARVKETMRYQATASLAAQREREASDTLSFEEFLEAYDKI
jgi:glutamate--cysteine ligase